MDQLMQKLINSKAIMDKLDETKGSPKKSLPQSMVEDFSVPQAKYNIPQEFLQEQPTTNQPYLSQVPRENTKPVGVPTVDAIKNSKLPDEIKRLMIEHPIAPAQQPQMTISNELVEKASRLMKGESHNYIPESAKPKIQSAQTQQIQGVDYNVIQKMITEAVNNALKNNGLLVESSEKSNEQFSFKVGKHVFEGKVTKVKKVV